MRGPLYPFMYKYIFVRVYVDIFAYLFTYKYTYVYAHVHIRIHIYVCIRMCMYFTYTHMHIVYETRIYGRRVTLPYYRPSSAVYVNEHIYNAPLQLHRRGVALPYHW